MKGPIHLPDVIQVFLRLRRRSREEWEGFSINGGIRYRALHLEK
jgi:hypothetical protein